MENPEVLEAAGKRVVLLGNEAIARGALEAGVGFSACYPGTPSSEVGTTLSDVATHTKRFYFEWSANEKVAFEACTGAAYCGVRSITAVKHFGFNVASDSVFPVAYTGVKGGLVIVVADDPLGHSSAQSEQDSRYYARMGNIPVLEPSNAQECRELTKKAFEISGRFGIPVILRTTTMVSHSVGTVRLGRIVNPKTRGRFVKDFSRYDNVTPNLQRMHAAVLKKLDAIEGQYSNLNSVEGRGDVGIIASGVSYEYVKEIVDELGIDAKIGKLTLTHPISRRFVSDFLKGIKAVIVLEELEPIVEGFVAQVAKDANPAVKIYGKNILPRIGEYDCDIIHAAIAPVLGIRKPAALMHEKRRLSIPTRKPVLCQGCPHRSTFYAVKKALGDRPVFAGDIGCYVLGMYEPFKMQDFIISMGASMGIAHGIGKVSDQKVVLFIGDSTFFHAGMPGLANLVYNDPKPLVIILDNRVTAMTGHQPHPGSGFTGMGEKAPAIDIEKVVRSFGIDAVRTVNSFNVGEMRAAVEEFSRKDELAVIISRGTCRLFEKRLLRAQGKSFPRFQVDPARQKDALKHVEEVSCPAFIREGSRVYIKEAMCWGCTLCVQVCPPGTIRPAAQVASGKNGKGVKK